MSHNVLGIAPVTIIDRQLSFEYTIASRSTDVMVPISPALASDFAANVLAKWNAVVDAHNEVACLMLGSITLELHRQFENYSPYEMLQELKSMFEKQAGVERFDLIQTFHAYKQEEGKPVGPYVFKMKNYMAQLEHLSYVLPRDLSVGLIMNGLTRDFAGFIRNYNKHHMGKMISELHALLIEYENDLLLKEHPSKDETCHHCKEVGYCKRNCPAYLAELIKKKKQVGTASSSDIFVIELFSFPTKSWVYDTSCGTHICNTKHGLRGVRKLKQVEAIGSFDLVLPNGLDYALEFAARILNMVPIKKALEKRDTPDKLQQRSVKCIFIGYPKETMGYYFYFPPGKKIGVVSEVPMEVEGFEPHRASECLCLNVEVEKHSLGDLNEPTYYKAALLDLESNKWLDAMNAKMQSDSL
ncbi:hypothetical protein Tco_0282811 [Tanacetum coccineum]